MRKNNKINLLYFIIFILILIIIYLLNNGDTNNKKEVIIKNKLVKNKFNSLKSILGKPNFVELDYQNNMVTSTWMSPLDNFNGFGKYGGADLIKIYGNPSKKYHPHPANVFIILGKYINVPEILFGPLKYASETINIEQLFVPEKYSKIYYNTGRKEISLVTGSCASVTISAITVQFVIDMITKYEKNQNIIELYKIFRDEYDRRINNYLCGKGITEPIPWYDHTFFDEGDSAYLGNDKCGKNNIKEHFTHYPECKKLMEEDNNFCKNNPSNKCC